MTLPSQSASYFELWDGFLSDILVGVHIQPGLGLGKPTLKVSAILQVTASVAEADLTGILLTGLRCCHVLPVCVVAARATDVEDARIVVTLILQQADPFDEGLRSVEVLIVANARANSVRIMRPGVDNVGIALVTEGSVAIACPCRVGDGLALLGKGQGERAGEEESEEQDDRAHCR